MQHSAVETMKDFYGEEIVAPPDWLEWQHIIGFGTNDILKNIIAEASSLGGEVESGLSEIMVQTGGHLLESLPESLADLLPLLKEKLAAEELRRRFGKPLSLLAVPVFMDLARMDSEAHLDLQQSQGKIETLLETLSVQVMESLRFFIAERINAVERELKQHEMALAASTEISVETVGGLDAELNEFKPKFDEKKEQLNEQRRALYGLWQKIEDSFNGFAQKTHAPMMNVVEQSTAPALMAA